MLLDDTIKMIYPVFIREPFETKGGRKVFKMAAVDYFICSHHVDEFEEQAKMVPERSQGTVGPRCAPRLDG